MFMKSPYAALAVLWLSGAAAAAQDPATLRDLRPGMVIRIEATTLQERLEGTLHEWASDTITIRPINSPPRPIAISDVTALWSRGRATKTGALVGGAIGGLGGGIVLSLLCAIGSTDDGVIGNEGFDPGCAALGAGLGLLVGGGVGAGVGASIPTWRLRFGTPR